VSGWWLFGGIGFGVIYLALLLTLGTYTLRKGHIVWFVLGFLIPPLWLVGALLKPKPGSSFARQERERWSRHGG
jgi:hypothetical protein